MNQYMPPKRSDPKYIEALIAKKPHREDPREQVITDKIRESVLSEQWAKDAFSRVGDLQKEYLREVKTHVDDTSFVHDKTQDALKEIAGLLKSRIIEGDELLDDVPRGSPVLIATNHFGAYKLLGLDPRSDLGVDIRGYDWMYPYPMYFAALSPVAQKLGDDLYYASDDFPGIFGQIHSEAGFIHVPPAAVMQQGRTDFLVQQTAALYQKNPHAAVVNFPEGGTSGKYSGKGPYDLDPFKTGAYVIASKLGVHIVPVAQYFHPHNGFQLRVFDPYVPDVSERSDYEKMAAVDKEKMQAWLDEQK